MARLRLPVFFSEAYMSGSMSGGRPGERRVEIADAGKSFVGCGARYQRDGRNGACIDHRVLRCIRRDVDADLVERLTRRLHPDSRIDRIPADLIKGERIGERLGYRLNREFDCGIAGLINISIRKRQRQPESSGFGAGELGDVGGQRSIRDARVFVSDLVQVPLNQFGHAWVLASMRSGSRQCRFSASDVGGHV
jgi:hypothetical protein